MNNREEDQIKNLSTEEILSSAFIVLGILSIYGDEIQKKYIKTKNRAYEEQANNIFDLILFITLILYLIFLYRNYKRYQESPENTKYLFEIKLLGSLLLLAGILCTIYFQQNIKTPTAAPEL